MRGLELTDTVIEPSLFEERHGEVLVSDRPARVQLDSTVQRAITGLEIEGPDVHVQLAERCMGFREIRVDGDRPVCGFLGQTASFGRLKVPPLT